MALDIRFPNPISFSAKRKSIPDGMMTLPMPVTTLWKGIVDLKDIGGGGNGLSRDSNGQQPDPKPGPRYQDVAMKRIARNAM